MSLIANLLGGPGSGKSTLAAQIFHHLKTEGQRAELNDFDSLIHRIKQFKG
jgi:adenylylsulfate kinase-like enzyme